MKLITKLSQPMGFLLINFYVSFLSDICLNDLSSHYGILTSLRPYFYKQSILMSGNIAGITIVIALLINMFISYFLLGFIVPYNLQTLLYFSILAFGLGYVIDILIDKMKVFGNRLDAFYKELGSGFWGAVTFVFCIVISYFIQKNICLIL
jgi:hypothetical protein